MRVPLAWRQLAEDPRRLTAALAGVVFAVILMLMQLGFRAAMLDSAQRYHRRLVYDLALISPSTVFIGLTHTFPRSRLYQAAGDPEVDWVSPVYCYQQYWKNPWRNNRRNLLVVGVDPRRVVLDTPGAAEGWKELFKSDAVLFDELSRPEFGPVGEQFRKGEAITAEVGDRRLRVAGLFRMGTSFAIDGNLLVSDETFQLLFPGRGSESIDIGLIKLKPGADTAKVRARLAAALPADVEVLTRSGFARREIQYWNRTTPIGYVFGFGLLMGLVVGGIIVYQILFADVSDHLAEYATLRAVGWTFRDVAQIVVQQALILAVLGFLPGLGLSALLYVVAGSSIRMPMSLTLVRIVAVFALTLLMCAVSGFAALRRLAAAEPSEVFR